jgi:hypothetical protein
MNGFLPTCLQNFSSDLRTGDAHKNLVIVNFMKILTVKTIFYLGVGTNVCTFHIYCLVMVKFGVCDWHIIRVGIPWK